MRLGRAGSLLAEFCHARVTGVTLSREQWQRASKRAIEKNDDGVVMQIQLTKRQDVVLITREYIAHEEAHLRMLEQGERPQLRLAGE